jgi:hypothetical protein
MKCLPSTGHIQYVDGRGRTTKIVTRRFYETRTFDCTNKTLRSLRRVNNAQGSSAVTHTQKYEATNSSLTINQNSCRPDQEEGFLMDVTQITEGGRGEFIMDTVLAD